MMFDTIHEAVELRVARRGTALLVRAEEVELISAASAKRQEEFLLGRSAAREALQAIGGPTGVPILRGDRGEPLWPAGCIGSIAHAGDIAVAAAASKDRIRSIGIDLEDSARRVDARLIRRICADAELPLVSGGARALLELFVAKEALYKALYPLTGTYFGFKDAELTKKRRGGFRAKLVKDLSAEFGKKSALDVAMQCKQGYLLAVVVVENPSAT